MCAVHMFEFNRNATVSFKVVDKQMECVPPCHTSPHRIIYVRREPSPPQHTAGQERGQTGTS